MPPASRAGCSATSTRSRGTATVTRPGSCCTRKGTLSLASNTTRASSPDTNVLTEIFGIETGPTTRTLGAARHSTGRSRSGASSRARPSTGTSQRPPSSATGDGSSLRSPSTDARLFLWCSTSSWLPRCTVTAPPFGSLVSVAPSPASTSSIATDLALGARHGGDLAPLGGGQDREGPAGRRHERGDEGQEAREGASEAVTCHSAVEVLQHRQSKGTARQGRKARLPESPEASSLSSDSSSSSRRKGSSDAFASSAPVSLDFSQHRRRTRGVESRWKRRRPSWPPKSTRRSPSRSPSRSRRPRARPSGRSPASCASSSSATSASTSSTPIPLPGHGAPRVHGVLREVQRLPPERSRPRGDRPHRRVPAAGARRPAAARRLRHEDPEEVRRPRLHQRRVQPRDDAARQLLRQPRRAALRAPVDRRAAAAQDLRHRGAEEEVPAPLRRGRDLGLRPDRARRRLRPRARADHRGEDRGRLAPTSSTAPSSGPRTARSRSCSW